MAGTVHAPSPSPLCGNTSQLSQRFVSPLSVNHKDYSSVSNKLLKACKYKRVSYLHVSKYFLVNALAIRDVAGGGWGKGLLGGGDPFLEHRPWNILWSPSSSRFF